MTVSTASLSFTRDSCFQNDHNGAVVMMHCNGNDDSDCTDALRSIAAIILSPPTCIDDKSYDDDDMPRLVSPRVVSPIVTCSLEQPLKGALAVNGFRDSAKKSRKHSRSGGHRLVGFSDNVSVIFIPRRCDYPKDLRDQLFPNKREISRNAARNMKEFASDGFDWRNVKEGKCTNKRIMICCSLCSFFRSIRRVPTDLVCQPCCIHCVPHCFLFRPRPHSPCRYLDETRDSASCPARFTKAEATTPNPSKIEIYKKRSQWWWLSRSGGQTLYSMPSTCQSALTKYWTNYIKIYLRSCYNR